jgi:hypothetical protein
VEKRRAVTFSIRHLPAEDDSAEAPSRNTTITDDSRPY